MKQLKEALVVQLDDTTNLIRPNTPPYETQRLSRELFDKAMVYLEAAKQENFSPETLEIWYKEFVRRGFTNEKFQKAVANAIGNKTYSRVKFDDFLTNETLYTEEEIAMMVQQRINQRKEQFSRLLQPSEEQLAREGLLSVQEYWTGELRRQIEKHAEEIDKKCRRLRAQFHLLDDQAKIDLWSKAVQKGLVKDGDRHAMLILPHLVPEMMEEFEEAVKNASVAYA